MTCPRCARGETSWESREELREDRSWGALDPTEVVPNGQRLASDELVRCPDCAAVWLCESTGGYYDPRDSGGPPSFMLHRAALLEGPDAALAAEVTFARLEAALAGQTKLPLMFQWSCVDALSKTEPERLRAAFEAPSLGALEPLRGHLDRWYREAFPQASRQRLRGEAFDGFRVLATLPDGARVLATAFLDDARLVCLVASAERGPFRLEAFDANAPGPALWSTPVSPAPFDANAYAPMLRCEGGYVFTLHRGGGGEGEHGFLAKPDRLLVHDAAGRRTASVPLAWACYEVDPTRERGFSECRPVHTFGMTWLDGVMLLAHRSRVVALDPATGAERWAADLPGGHRFTGRAFRTSRGLGAALLKGFVELGLDGKLLDGASHDCHPVAVDARGRMFFFHGKVFDPKTRETSVLAGLDPLRAEPIFLPGAALLFGGYGDTSRLLDDDLKPVAELDLTCDDLLGPHALRPSFRTRPLTWSGRFVVGRGYKGVRLFDRRGKTVAARTIAGPLEALFAFGAGVAFVHGLGRRVAERDLCGVEVLSAGGEAVFRSVITEPQTLAGSAAGLLATSDDERLLVAGPLPRSGVHAV